MKKLILLVILFYGIKLDAQITIYDSLARETEIASKDLKSNKYEMLLFSTDLVEPFLAGTIPIYVEKNISQRFSVQAGLGMTFNSLAARILTLDFQKKSIDDLSQYSTISPNINLNDYTIRTTDPIDFSSRLNFMVSGTIRYYLDDEMDETSHVGLNVNFRDYNVIGKNSSEKLTFNKLTSNIIYGKKLRATQNFFMEFFAGMGASYLSNEYEFSYYSKTNSNDYGYGTIAPKGKIIFNMVLGFRLCFGTFE